MPTVILRVDVRSFPATSNSSHILKLIGGTHWYNLFWKLLVHTYLINQFVPWSMIRSIWQWMNLIIHFRVTGNTSTHGFTGAYLLILWFTNSSDHRPTTLIALLSSPMNRLHENIPEAGCNLCAQATYLHQKVNADGCLLGIYWSQIVCRRLFPWTNWILGTYEFGIHVTSVNRKCRSSPKGLKIRKQGIATGRLLGLPVF